ncbi:AAC(3) family N-acetyltransferase [Helicobacter cappadocius]|uniref:Aminoglycoside N(3)-acetyltransferase n=1 Tax=Helicobacter cappadocius TaxID=3063998 RepID=A0AA90SSA9_9HELI|nr:MULTISPECIES: AAC(3) family N-acetyltransferase [unclassified Helicobacter]MDO7253935.1 AAC(3) family N-acetyltransferase [Helicobacter sp. faydin-H75]MDP2538699.1 AAC(3) family N-acetyltransferase [Helicobacter sp. faydin-H76]
MQDLNTILFIDKNNPITKNDILNSLLKIGAQECDYLFVHSELNFGTPNTELSKKELLGHIVDIFDSMRVKNIIMPTFSFSFCAKEDFDLKNTKSPMGILSEYFRKLQNAKRTIDPLMSCAIIGEDKDLLDISKHSCGIGSLFDKLHHKKDVKFLFFGNRVCDCFTYSHYIERMLEVPYRYDKVFEGNIILDDKSYKDSFILPVRYANVEAFKDDTLNKTLDKYNAIKEIKLGQTQIQIVNEKDSYKIISEAIKSNIDFMLEFPYPRDFLDKSYTYGKKVAL